MHRTLGHEYSCVQLCIAEVIWFLQSFKLSPDVQGCGIFEDNDYYFMSNNFRNVCCVCLIFICFVFFTEFLRPPQLCCNVNFRACLFESVFHREFLYQHYSLAFSNYFFGSIKNIENYGSAIYLPHPSLVLPRR